MSIALFFVVFLMVATTSDGTLDILLGKKDVKKRGGSTRAAVEPNTAPQATAKRSLRPVNILLMLADDLGYADTSVHPFVGSGIRTPELERMAARGMVMTNFHTAAATCTPTRASILTGLYPWRMGIKGVYEYGEKIKEGGEKKSNRDDFLPHMPTVAMAFREYNYSTGHSGKWHVGGMRNDDYDLRMLPELSGPRDPRRGKSGGSGRRCPHPGPNQQGFEQYVSVLDGPGAKRQNELQVNDELYTKGCEALLHNDKEIGREGGTHDELLSDCEVRHAIRMMKESLAKGKPFYQQVWFHAPHGPWEEVPGFRYPDQIKLPLEQQPLCSANKTVRYCAQAIPGARAPGAVNKRSVDRGVTRLDKYKTMVTAMDRAIGTLMRAVRDLGVERDTLVVFTSDNGPEDDTGTYRHERLDEDNPWYGEWQGYTTGIFRGNKRWVYEGGVRVPMIAQWVGTIPKGSQSSTFASTVDLLPTFLDAAGLSVPSHFLLDGMSIMPDLAHATLGSSGAAAGVKAGHEGKDAALQLGSLQGIGTGTGTGGGAGGTNHAQTSRYICSKAARRQFRRKSAERLVLWHNDFEGPRMTAARFYDFKLILNGSDYPKELYDLRVDVGERRNLLAVFHNLTTEEVLGLRITAAGVRTWDGAGGGGGSGGGGVSIGSSGSGSGKGKGVAAEGEVGLFQSFLEGLADAVSSSRKKQPPSDERVRAVVDAVNAASAAAFVRRLGGAAKAGAGTGTAAAAAIAGTAGTGTGTAGTGTGTGVDSNSDQGSRQGSGQGTTTFAALAAKGGIPALIQQPRLRAQPAFHLALLQKLHPILLAFATDGDEPWRTYLKSHSGRVYNLTVESDVRHARQNVYAKVNRAKALLLRQDLMNGTCGKSDACGCAVPHKAQEVPVYPLYSGAAARKAVLEPKGPRGVFNATAALW